MSVFFMEGGIILKEVKIKSIIERDNEIIANADFFVDKKIVANVLVEADERIKNNKSDMFEANAELFVELINKDFDKYTNLPKLTECSNILCDLFDISFVDDLPLIISAENWNDYFFDKYSLDEINNLNRELKELKLDNVVDINEEDCIIRCDKRLYSYFNDDRDLDRSDPNFVYYAVRDNKIPKIIVINEDIPYKKLNINLNSLQGEKFAIGDLQYFDSDVAYYKGRGCNNFYMNVENAMKLKEIYGDAMSVKINTSDIEKLNFINIDRNEQVVGLIAMRHELDMKNHKCVGTQEFHDLMKQKLLDMLRKKNEEIER